jgi:Na+/H+-dicarboxylate symporter
LLDTFRTMVNVEGDMVGSLVVQKLVRGHADPSGPDSSEA